MLEHPRHNLEYATAQVHVVLQLFNSTNCCYTMDVKFFGFVNDAKREKETELQYNKYILFLPKTPANITVRDELGQFSIYFVW